VHAGFALPHGRSLRQQQLRPGTRVPYLGALRPGLHLRPHGVRAGHRVHPGLALRRG